MDLLSILIAILIILCVGGICFWAIDKFSGDAKLSYWLKLLVVLICVGAALSRVWPLVGSRF